MIKYEEIKLIEEKMKCDQWEELENTNDEYRKDYEQLIEYIDETSSNEAFKTIIWDDTFEIITVKQIEIKGNLYTYIYRYIYTLNEADTKRLNHCFKCVEELFLQIQNLRIYLNHQSLTNNNINVYYVKTDAFTVDANNI